MGIQQNVDRIQTTHIGSLPRPHNLLDLMKAKFTGKPYDEAALESTLTSAVKDSCQETGRMRHRYRHRRRILQTRLFHLHPGTA